MIGVILWKHVAVRFNRFSTIVLTLCELIIPVLAFLIIIYAKSNVGNLEKVYVNESTYQLPIPKDEVLTRINVGSTSILYAPETEFTEALIREVQLKLSLYNEDIQAFNSKESLFQFYNKYEQAGITVAVLFTNVGHTMPHQLDYGIMIHEEAVLWDTDKLFSDQFVYTPGIGSETYLDKAFAAVQVAMDISYIEMVTKSQFNTHLSLQEFPYPPHLNTDGVTTAFRYILPFVTIITFIFICPITLKRIVLEKSSGLKELLKIGGVKSLTLWCGWYLNGIVINAISVVFVAVLLTQKLFSSNYPVIEHCNVILLAIFLFLYCSATVTFFFTFSTFFEKAFLAMVLGILLWIISYSVFLGMAAEVDVMSSSIKALFALLPTIALYYGYSAISLFELRETDLTFWNLFESPTSSTDDLSLGFVMVMLVIDTILYFMLALYLDKIWPGPYGISKPWYFLIQKVLRKICRSDIVPEIAQDDTLLTYYETSTLTPIVQLQNVKKIYENNVAVDDLTWDIYKGTITSLLGENGAGKTTTMSMLTGLTKATSGSILIDGYNINDNVDEARKKISICTQGNFLYEELTVLQHLQLFGMLKGMSVNKAREAALYLLENTLNLSKKANKFVIELSGGMKRKLSLGIALMGDPEILILDEPTSGVDIEGRQDIWDLIASFKGKRTVLISTHFLEEAEYLSDYIAIMNAGRLLCNGTPMNLKKKYDVGYKCVISYNDDKQLEEINSILQKFNEESAIEQKAQHRIIQCSFNDSTKCKIPALLEELKKKNTLSISYKLTSSTLEDVYLKVQPKHSESTTFEQTCDAKVISCLQRRIRNWIQQMRKCWLFLQKKWMHYLFLVIVFFGIVFLTFILGKSGYQDVSKDGARFPMTLSKYGITDVYYSITSGIGNGEKLENLYTSIVKSENSIPTRVANVSNTIIAKGVENIAHYMKRMVIATEFTLDEENRLSEVILLHSNKALHGSPISINVATNAILKYVAGDDYSISVVNTPLHSNKLKQQALTQSEFSNLFLWLTLLPIGPLLLVSTALLLPSTEFTKSTRILERLCGMTSVEYWIYTFFWSALFYLAVIFILFVLLLVPLHAMDLEAIVALCYVLLSYGLVCIPFAYIFTHANTVEGAFASFLIIHIIVAPIAAGIGLALEAVENYRQLIEGLKMVAFVLDPHILLCYVLAKFSIKVISNHNWDVMPADRKRYLCYENARDNPCCDLTSVECIKQRAYVEDIRLGYILLAFFGYMLLLILIDFFRQWGVEWWHKRSLLCRGSNQSIGEKPNNGQNILVATSISKTYLTWEGIRLRSIEAVKDLTFQLTKGKCLGLLGLNGAGKSTSFRILTEEKVQTSGTLRSGKNEYLTKGYCPQHNALLDDFTGREFLTYFGRLRGLESEANKKAVNQLLTKFGMEKIANKACGTYSGGNKRKLATCISIIGFPACIFLDEPTSGVDPVSRRELWDVIGKIKQCEKSGIILTSHSMDECEALCDSLCILKEGKVVDDGLIQVLKEKYCVGHVLDIKFKPNRGKDGDQIDGTRSCEKFLRDSFKDVQVVGVHNGIMQVRIFNSDWSTIFQTMEKMRQGSYDMDDYRVKEASLQEVLMHVKSGDSTDGACNV